MFLVSARWKDIRQWLEATYYERQIGRGGAVAWHLRSQCLTPIDSFLLGHLNKQIYAVPPSTIGDLVIRFWANVSTADAKCLNLLATNFFFFKF